MDTGAELATLIVWTACWYIINSKARSYRSFPFHQTIGNTCNPDWRKLYVKTFNPGLNLWIHINDCINPAIALGTLFLIRKWLHVCSYLKRVGTCYRQENERHSIYTVTFFLCYSIKSFFYLHFVWWFLTFLNTMPFVPSAIKANIKFIFSQHCHIKQK